MQRFGSAALAGCIALAAATAEAYRPEWTAASGKPIASVTAETNPVFDPNAPGQSSRLFRWANALHFVTRPRLVRREFHQEPGDPFNPRLAEETERNLRLLGLFQDARVLVDTLGGDSVRVRLYTIDRWSLKSGPVFESQGGITSIGLKLGERNLLGLGIEVELNGIYSTDVSEASAFFRKQRFLGSFWDVSFGLRSDGLGNGQSYAFVHPFYSDTVDWSADLVGAFSSGTRRIFEEGIEVARLETDEDAFENSLAWHVHGPVLQRLSVFHTRRHVSGDVTDDVGAAGLAWAFLHRHSRYQPDIDRMGPDEETGAGWALQLAGGADLEILGAATPRPFWRADGAVAGPLGGKAFAGLQARWSGFYDDDRIRDGRAWGELYGWWRVHPKSLFAWRLGGDAFLDDLPYRRFALGSDDRLRGYEARALNGTRTLYGGIENRIFTDRRLLFARLGATVFVDAAAAWDAGETLDWSEARLGAGLGLRIAADPTGSNVTRIDFGFGTNSFYVSLASGSFHLVARALQFPGLRMF